MALLLGLLVLGGLLSALFYALKPKQLQWNRPDLNIGPNNISDQVRNGAEDAKNTVVDGVNRIRPNLPDGTSSSTIVEGNDNNTKTILNCNEGYFLFNGKCLSCPSESRWNGTNCVKTELVNVTTTTITNSSGTFVINGTDGQPTKISHLYEDSDEFD